MISIRKLKHKAGRRIGSDYWRSRLFDSVKGKEWDYENGRRIFKNLEMAVTKEKQNAP